MTLELLIPADHALEITEVLSDLMDAFALDGDALSDPRTVRAHHALQQLQRALKPLERSIRAEVARLDDDAELPF